MAIALPGYQIQEQIISSARTVIYRGIRERDNRSIVVKTLKAEYPTLEDIAHLRQEYGIRQNLDIEGIVKAYSLETHGQGYALILEDMGGESLDRVLAAGDLTLRECLRVAITLAKTLGELHKVPIIHKDVKPSNIIIDRSAGRVKLTDFSIASPLRVENPALTHPRELEGTLAYMSPEQTGRMNRSLDCRTDFYSLGTTLYEMLTGRVPCDANEPMELVHCHIAKQPVPPHLVETAAIRIPEIVSNLTMKLLAKMAEDRYQSAAGLQYDLEKCLWQLETTGKIEAFPLGSRDRSSQLPISQKLYGREREVRSLLNAFARVGGLAADVGITDSPSVTSVSEASVSEASVANRGQEEARSHIMLVSGYSGIGKTRIVSEIHKPIVAARGYFIAGKFDQFQRNIPYAALIRAFRELARQLLAESEAEIAVWREKLSAALGANGRVIVEVIPEIELIIGSQPEIPQLGAIESQNRFNRVFQQFIDVFCQAEHPLVLFLDDLQWADSASLKLLEMLVAEPDRRYLLAIGAYRDNEVSPTHPLTATLEKIAASGAVMNEIAVRPLELHHVNQLVADTLGNADEDSEIWQNRLAELAELVFNKTQGNPFFLTQMLKALAEENLLAYDVAVGRWEWDLSEIQAVGIADYGVVELMARNIQKLPETTQEILKRAACLGNLFSIEELAIANGESTAIAASGLWEALQAGLILPLSNAYKVLMLKNWPFGRLRRGTGNGPFGRLRRGMGNGPFGRLRRGMGNWELGDKGDMGGMGDNPTPDTRHPTPFSDAQFPMPHAQFSVSFQFLHDRVQQAAYSLIPEAEKKATHLEIGQLLLEAIAPAERKDRIFALVNQLNHGTDLLAERDKKEELARLNLMAGQKAKESAAYEAALNYLDVGLNLLAPQSSNLSNDRASDPLSGLTPTSGQSPEAGRGYEVADAADSYRVDSWTSNYDLTLDLHVEAVEASYLIGNFQRSQALAEVALDRAQTLLEKVNIYELQIQSDMAQMQMLPAIETGLAVLDLLGIALEQEPPQIGNIEDCYNLPAMTAPYKLAALRLLTRLIYPAYVANPALLSSIIFTTLHLSVKYGNSAYSAFVGYCMYGVILCDSVTEIEAGYRYGQLAVRLLDKFADLSIQCRTLYEFHGFIQHWKEHIRETVEPLQEALSLGIECGNLEIAGYASIMYCNHIFFKGEHLERVTQKVGQYADWLAKLNQEYTVVFARMWQQLGLNLLGKAEDKLQLKGAAFDETEMLPIFREAENGTALFSLAGAKMMLLYLFKEGAAAALEARDAEQYAHHCAGMMMVAEHNFYYSLALLACYRDLPQPEQRESLSQVAANQHKMKLWADRCPMNFQHKYELVAAEKARVLGYDLEAIDYYERAISGAKEGGFIHEEALANELAGEFQIARQHPSMGKFYIIEAYYAYIRWGATAKARDLEERYPLFLSEIAAPQTPASDLDLTRTRTSSGGRGSDRLDLSAALKAAQAISGEIVLSELLDKLMKIAIENAGAQKGILLLNEGGTPRVAAFGEIRENKITVWEPSPVGAVGAVGAGGAKHSASESELKPTSSDKNASPLQVMPMSIANYVQRTQTSLVLNDAKSDRQFAKDPYLVENQPKSLLCSPILNQGKLVGLLYLENNLTEGAFTSDRLELLNLISSQAAISLENARLYANLETANQQLEGYSRNLEQKVKERTQELEQKNEDLNQALSQVQQTQAQLIQSEKMSGLGQMVAGIAHEINNPINFIHGNVERAEEYIDDLLGLISLYRETYPEPEPDIEEEIEAIELNFIEEDVPKLLSSMKGGTTRIRDIVRSLRIFSRLDEAEMKAVDIHAGIDSTLTILQHRLHPPLDSAEIAENNGQPDSGNPNIETIKEYGALPEVECYAGEMNQVFMHVISNAIDALMGNGELPAIRICTEVIDGKSVAIRIADNGPGMSEEVRGKAFDPFFTTKPVGSGTGLGLSVSYSIVVQKHGGRFDCVSEPGRGTEFIIEIPIKQRSRPQIVKART